MMNKWYMKVLVAGLVLYGLFKVFTDPEGAAAAVLSFFKLFGALSRFFRALAQGG